MIARASRCRSRRVRLRQEFADEPRYRSWDEQITGPAKSEATA